MHIQKADELIWRLDSMVNKVVELGDDGLNLKLQLLLYHIISVEKEIIESLPKTGIREDVNV